MKVFIIVLAVVLAVIFVGGSVNLGGDSIFGHIDSALGTSVLTRIHAAVFFFLDSGRDQIDEELTQTGEDLREFEERPIGIDNKKKYKQLDDASKY